MFWSIVVYVRVEGKYHPWKLILLASPWQLLETCSSMAKKEFNKLF